MRARGCPTSKRWKKEEIRDLTKRVGELEQVNEDKVSSSSDDNSGRGNGGGKNSWWLRVGHECEVEEEDFAHREAIVRGTGKRGRNGKTGGDDGKETDQKGHDDVRIGRRAIDRSGRCFLEQDHRRVSERTGPACGRVVT